tara:strand:- start:342 stop:821 length:480 start_codon:yes stop_codon:yes gene_type:complete
MHFVRYHPLKEKLRNRSVSDREALPYLVIFAALTALIGAFPAVNGFNEWDLISGLLSVAFAVGGIIYAYRSNGAEEGFDLIQKYVVLGWVVTVRCLLVFIPLAIVAYIAGDSLGLVTAQTGFLDVLLISIFELVLYQRIGRHIRDTTTTSSEQDVDPNA